MDLRSLNGDYHRSPPISTSGLPAGLPADLLATLSPSDQPSLGSLIGHFAPLASTSFSPPRPSSSSQHSPNTPNTDAVSDDDEADEIEVDQDYSSDHHHVSPISRNHHDHHKSADPNPFQASEDEPLYVNAKQYHRILKRRAARARLEEMNRLHKERKVSPRACALLISAPLLPPPLTMSVSSTSLISTSRDINMRCVGHGGREVVS
jgi:hypothetical protein